MSKYYTLIVKNVDKAYTDKKLEINVPYNEVTLQLCDFLQKEGLINGYFKFSILRKRKNKEFKIQKVKIELYTPNFQYFSSENLAYAYNIFCLDEENNKKLNERDFKIKKPYTNLRVISTPSNIIRINNVDLGKKIKLGITYVLLTSKGILTDRQCVRLKLGGTILFVYSF